MRFPTIRPNGANYIRPRQGEALDLTPPGFCWWRAAERGACQYRLLVTRDGAAHYTSPLTSDPIHVPEVAFAPGSYAWHVQAIADDGRVGAVSEQWTFSINPSAPEQPWIDPRNLLDRVPPDHPRIFFLASQLAKVRATLHSTRAEAFKELRRMADAGLSVDPIPEPDYDRIADPAERRLAYFQSFHDTRAVHDQAMRALALTYLLTGERRYGEHARLLLLDAASWDPEGISSVLAPYGDEVGLGLLKVGAEVYDWLYDLLSEGERAQVAAMLVARADQMIHRLEQNDYTYRPEGSHDGRLPGFLLEHALALAEHPRAAEWAGYALKIIATNFPHWAGQDGGWAQGVPYAMFYNLRDIMPFHAWKLATGHDVWLKPFYQKLPWFFYYAVSPVGEIMPFGDSEHLPVRPLLARTLMFYHGLRLQDARLCRWADQVQEGAQQASLDPFPAILVEDRVERAGAHAPANDRLFRGIGWAALHSDVTRPQEDLMVLLRSSPYGGVSHGHASQNDFAVMKGGVALICAGGERFPHHGSPFHTEYAQQSISHNCVLVDGKGAINRDGNRGGEMVAFETNEAFGYACGEAQNAYGGLLNKWRRHLVLVRPSILILIDDIRTPQPVAFQWLLHALQRFELGSTGDLQTIVSRRDGACLTGRLAASTALHLSQTDAWPIEPDEGYPTLTRPLPVKRWHLTAETKRTDRIRIACLFSVQGPGEAMPEISLSVEHDRVSFQSGAGVQGVIELSTDSTSVLQLACRKYRLAVEASVQCKEQGHMGKE